MNTANGQSVNDLVIEHGMAALLICSPLAFGSVHVWASSLLQIGSFIIFFAWLATVSRNSSLAIHGWQFILPAALFALFVLFQLVPLPPFLLKALSPASAGVYASMGDAGAGVWHPISIHPQATLQELLNYMAYLAAFIVVVNHWRRREQVFRVVHTIIVIGCVLVIIAALQKVFWNGRLYWFYPIDPALQSRLNEIWGPYVNKNHFAGYLEMTIPFALGSLFYSVARGEGHGDGSIMKQMMGLAASNRLARVAALVLAVALMIGALFATLSRGAAIGFVTSFVFFVVMARSRRSLRTRTILVLFLSVLLAVIGIIAAWDRIETRFLEIANEDRFPRSRVWMDLFGVVRDFPLFGSGFGTFDRAFPHYQSRFSTVIFEHAENDYLEILTDTGLIGAGIVVFMGILYFQVMLGMWRRRRSLFATTIGLGGIASCVALAVHGLSDFNLRVPANAFLFAVVSGMTYAVLNGGRDKDDLSGRSEYDEAH